MTTDDELESKNRMRNPPVRSIAEWNAEQAERPLSAEIAAAAAPSENVTPNVTLWSPIYPYADEIKLDPKNDEEWYIAGPMTSYPDHNYPAFNSLAKYLRTQGNKVNNPAENFGGDQTRDLAEYMIKDVAMVMRSKHIVMLPGWRQSDGGRIEATLAKAIDAKFYEATDKLASESGEWEVRPMPTPEWIGGPEAHARSLVYGARNETYGPPDHDFMCIGRIWAAILSAYTNTRIDDIPPDVVAVLLSGMKLARQGRTPDHYDSRVDVMGYQLCLDRIVTKDGKEDG
jgi:hypothetical protein